MTAAAPSPGYGERFPPGGPPSQARLPSHDPRVFIIAGLGYGDEGKGTTVDWLVRRYAPGHGRQTVVVRYNGGAQAAHNVVLPCGTHHTFSQFGSGTLAGAATFLSHHMIVNPATMLVETDVLRTLPHAISIGDPLSRVHVDERALVTTRFHVAANRIRELVAGRGSHGSCGMGVHETVRDYELGRPSLRVADLRDPVLLTRKLAEIQESKRAELLVPYSQAPEYAKVQALEDEFSMLTTPSVVDVLAGRMSTWAGRVSIVADAWLEEHLRKLGTLTIFEGAQGVLLDQTHGFFPHVTHSDTTFANADALLADAGYDGPVLRYGVTRTYQTRHGAGPMPTARPDLDVLLAHDHNHCPRPGPSQATWQGRMRAGELDLVTARHAVAYIGKLDGIVFTHADVVDPADMPVCMSYVDADRIPMMHHEATHKLVAVAQPDEIRNMSVGEFAERLGSHVVVTSHGPTHEHKKET